MLQVNEGMSRWETYVQWLMTLLQNRQVEAGATRVGVPEQWELHRSQLGVGRWKKGEERENNIFKNFLQ